MRKVFIVVSSLIMLLGSCKPSTKLVSELTTIDYKYYKKQPQKLFTGIAITKFENGLISSSTEVKEGVPNGNWFDYGYKGEVIHEGKFLPLQLEEFSITEKNIERLNISFWKEDAYSFIDAYIVGQKISDKGFDTVKLKKNIEQLLRQKNIIAKTDSINELKIVKGELE
jgi:hypothetical protein